MEIMNLETRRPFSLATLSEDPRVTPGPFPHHAHQTMCLVGSRAKHASYADVCDPTTARVMSLDDLETVHAATYMPMSYAVQIDSIRDTFSALIGSEPVYEVYALNDRNVKDKDGNKVEIKGAHMFGKIAWHSDVPGIMIEVVLRSSLDGTITLQYGPGIGTFICANGMIQAENLISLKHTKNIEERFAASLVDPEIGAVARIEAARERAQWVGGLKEIPMSDDLFHAFLGVLRGRMVMGRNGRPSSTPMLTPHRMSAAMRYWAACHSGELHAEHGRRDLFSGYQALTGAAHLSTVRNSLQTYAGIDFMTEQVEQSGGSLVGIPAFTFDIAEY